MAEAKHCFIYFIQQGDGPIKIGHTNNLQFRLDNLQIGNPEILNLILSIGPMSKLMVRNVERSLHRHFEPQSIRGEWYKPIIMKRLACEGGWTFFEKHNRAEIKLYAA